MRESGVRRASVAMALGAKLPWAPLLPLTSLGLYLDERICWHGSSHALIRSGTETTITLLGYSFTVFPLRAAS